jgi:hypothetical protein
MPPKPQRPGSTKFDVIRGEVDREIAAMSRGKRKRESAKLAPIAGELSLLWMRLEDHELVCGELSKEEWRQVRVIIQYWPYYALLEQRTVYRFLHRLNTMAEVMDQDAYMLEHMSLGPDDEGDDPDAPPEFPEEEDEEGDEDE